MTNKMLKYSTIAVLVAAICVAGCASPGGSQMGSAGGASGECNAGLAAGAGALIGGLLAQGSNRVRGAALGAGLAALACVGWNYNAKQTKSAEQVQKEYKSANREQLPTQSKVTRYDTRFESGAKVAPGGKMTVASNIEVVQGTADQKPVIEEELTLVRPDGSEVKSRKKANENQGAGAFSTTYSMTIPEGVPQGEYPVRTALYLNGNKTASHAMKLQVVSLPNGEMVALLK